MSSTLKPCHRTLLAAAVVTALAAPARADEKRELEQLRATTLGLIEALVQQGLIPRDRADALLRQAQAPAWGTPPPAAQAPAPAQAQAPVQAPAPVIRVPYQCGWRRRAPRRCLGLAQQCVGPVAREQALLHQCFDQAERGGAQLFQLAFFVGARRGDERRDNGGGQQRTVARFEGGGHRGLGSARWVGVSPAA